MEDFNPKEKAFLVQIFRETNENAWLQLSSYAYYKIKKNTKKGEIISMAGITFRYLVLPSLFVCVRKKHQKKGIGSKLIQELLVEWRLPLFLTYYRQRKLKPFYEKFGFKQIMKWRRHTYLMIKLFNDLKLVKIFVLIILAIPLNIIFYTGREAILVNSILTAINLAIILYAVFELSKEND